MRDDLPLVLDRIRRLLQPRSGQPGDDLLAEIEHTLTDGYAHALALEAERRRIEKRLAELARELGDDAEAAELRQLAERLLGAEDEHGTLHRLLVALRRRADDVRAAEALR